MNFLYIFPVVAVIGLCLLVYAFGFKSTSNTLPASSLALLREGPTKTKQNKSKISATVSKTKSSNGVANGSAAKPKAVVKPLKQEVKVKSVAEVPVLVKNPKKASKAVAVVTPIEEVDDLDGEGWITVEKPKKDLKKKKQSEITETEVKPVKESSKKDKKSKKEGKPEKKDEVKQTVEADPVVEPQTAKVAPIVVPLEALKPVEFEDWTVEDPAEENFSKIPSKKSIKNKEKSVKNKEKLLEKQLSREEEQLRTEEPKEVQVKQDKITKDIITQYDAPPVVKKEVAKKDKKKPDKKAANDVTKDAPKDAAKKDVAKKDVAKKDVGKKDVVKKEDSPKKDKKKKAPAAAVTLPVEVTVEAVASKPASGSSEVTDGKNIVRVLTII